MLAAPTASAEVAATSATTFGSHQELDVVAASSAFSGGGSASVPDATIASPKMSLASLPWESRASAPIAEETSPAAPTHPTVQFVSDETTSMAENTTQPSRSSETIREPIRLQTRPVEDTTPREVLYATEATFEALVLRSDKPVLVDFYATWCGPCKQLAPTLEEVARESSDAVVVKVNVDECPRLVARYAVHSLPTLLVFKNGRMTAKQKGIVPKSRVKAMLYLK